MRTGCDRYGAWRSNLVADAEVEFSVLPPCRCLSHTVCPSEVALGLVIASLGATGVAGVRVAAERFGERDGAGDEA
jgi:hypothetical protein